MDNFNSEISDEDFLKASPEDVMNEIDKQVDSYYQSQQSQNPNTEQSVPQEQATEGQSEQPTQEIDPSVYKEAYDYIMQPFKASGKDFQLKDSCVLFLFQQFRVHLHMFQNMPDVTLTGILGHIKEVMLQIRPV